jgi:ABC-type polysaccharide/polyol phosphate export permease
LIEIVPVIIVNFILIYGMSLSFAHIGLLYTDFKNFTSHLFRLWFYASPGIYTLSSVNSEYRWILRLNPATALFESYRHIVIYGKSPMYLDLSIWLIIGIIILFFGMDKIYKFDKNYAKVV